MNKSNKKHYKFNKTNYVVGYIADEETDINQKNIDLMIEITKYYDNKKHIEELLKYLGSDRLISMRMIEFFVSVYCDENSVIYSLKNSDKTIEHFNVGLRYRSAIGNYNKDYFDPFCRKQKITYIYKLDDDNYKQIHTSIGQLNFFKWAFIYRVLKYMKNNYEYIEKEKKQYDKENKIKRSQKSETKQEQNKEKLEPDFDIISSSENLISIDMRSDSSKASQSQTNQRKRKSKNSIDHIIAYSSSKGISIPCL